MLIIHIAFLLTGVVTTMLGPMLPFLIPHWRLTDLQAGQLFIAQFTGGFCGSLVAGQLMTRFGSRWSMVMGLALAAVGVVLLWSSHHVIGIAALFVYGSAMGITAPATNMLVAQAAPEKSAAALNLLNFSWTAGAMMGSGISWLLQNRTHPMHLSYAIAAALVIAAAVIAARHDRSASPAPTSTSTHTEKRQMPMIVLLAIPVLFLYVGVENGVAGWLPTFSTRTFDGQTWLTTSAQVLFWGSLLSGRLLAPLALRKMSAGSLITWALFTAMVGTLLVLAGAAPSIFLIGVAFSGLGLASILPTTLSQVTRFDAVAAGRFAGLMFAFAGLGGAAIPPMVGFVSSLSGSLRIGLTVAVFAIVLMLVVNLRISRLVAPVRARATGV